MMVKHAPGGVVLGQVGQLLLGWLVVMVTELPLEFCVTRFVALDCPQPQTAPAGNVER